MKKIAIVGCPASGKTSLAKKIAPILNIPVYHLDQLFWGGDTKVSDEEFMEKQMVILKREKWITEGDFRYSKSYDIRLAEADTIIFFNLSRALVFYRLIKRFICFFNKPRPDLGNNCKFHIDRNLLKYIWNYPMSDAHIERYKQDKNKHIILLKNTQDEKKLFEQIKMEYTTVLKTVMN